MLVNDLLLLRSLAWTGQNAALFYCQQPDQQHRAHQTLLIISTMSGEEEKVSNLFMNVR
jgi:hypothetical protein